MKERASKEEPKHALRELLTQARIRLSKYWNMIIFSQDTQEAGSLEQNTTVYKKLQLILVDIF